MGDQYHLDGSYLEVLLISDVVTTGGMLVQILGKTHHVGRQAWATSQAVIG
jgi:predicted amidophosphoribosyltransferase